MFNSTAGVDGVRRFVVSVDQISGPADRVSGNATRAGGRRRSPAGKTAGTHGSIGRVRSLKCGGPSVLREIVVKHPKTGSDHSSSAFSRRIRDSEAGAELRAVVVSNAHWNLQSLQSDIGGVLRLAAVGRVEQPERSLPAQPIVHRKMPCDAPGIFGIERQPLHILRKAAIVGRGHRSARVVIRNKLARVGQVEGWIVRELVQRFRISGKSAAEHRFVNEVDAELNRVIAGNVAYVVTQLIFFLIAQVGKQSDRRGELVVAEGFESRYRLRSGAEGKRQCEAKSGVASLREVQFAGAEYECAEPLRSEHVGVADDCVPVIIVRG